MTPRSEWMISSTSKISTTNTCGRTCITSNDRRRRTIRGVITTRRSLKWKIHAIVDSSFPIVVPKSTESRPTTRSVATPSTTNCRRFQPKADNQGNTTHGSFLPKPHRLKRIRLGQTVLQPRRQRQCRLPGQFQRLHKQRQPFNPSPTNIQPTLPKSSMKKQVEPIRRHLSSNHNHRPRRRRPGAAT